MDVTQTHIYSHTLIVTFPHIHTQHHTLSHNLMSALAHKHTDSDCVTRIHCSVFLWFTCTCTHFHTHSWTLKVSLARGGHCKPRQTAYYHVVKRKFQRQNKTRHSGKKESRRDEGREETEGKQKRAQKVMLKARRNKREKGTKMIAE